jgi:KUP system potassium uptake protein
MKMEPIDQDFDRTSVSIRDIASGHGAHVEHPKVDPMPPSFETLRRHDQHLRNVFLHGWSTGIADVSPMATNVDDFYDILQEPTGVEVRSRKSAAWLFFKNSWASLGIIYGDIGTSPIYTITSILAFIGAPPQPEDVKGAVSLILWSLLLIVCLKYIVLVLRTDYQGKGGIFALISLLFPTTKSIVKRELLAFLGCFAFGCMIADGALTPAISVLSAVEGVLIPAPQLGIAFTVPVAVVILIALFLYQRWGTAIVGYSFSPIITLWFISLGGFGIYWITFAPQIFEAFNPWLGINFVIRYQVAGWLNLAFVLLAVTGCEALYADLGHFGANPIRLSWFLVACPALMLNYIGQGALLLVDPTKYNASYFNMIQGPLYWPVFVLTLLATIIASQAMISAMFSLVQQAVGLDACPRMKIVHTNVEQEGQVYVPAANLLLGAIVIGVIVGFQRSAAVADAYGLAIAAMMVLTSILVCVVMHAVWHWWIIAIVPVMTPILILELGFLTGACSRIPTGAWFTVVVATIFTTILYIWHRGRVAMNVATSQSYTDIEEWQSRDQVPCVPSFSFFFTPLPVGIPSLVTSYTRLLSSLPSNVVITCVRIARIPHVPHNQQYLIETMGPGLWRLVLTFGFRQRIDFASICEELHLRGLPVGFRRPDAIMHTEDEKELHDCVSYVFDREQLEAKADSPWYHKLLVFLFAPIHSVQYPLAMELGVTSSQTIELGHSMKV